MLASINKQRTDRYFSALNFEDGNVSYVIHILNQFKNLPSLSLNAYYTGKFNTISEYLIKLENKINRIFRVRNETLYESQSNLLSLERFSRYVQQTNIYYLNSIE